MTVQNETFTIDDLMDLLAAKVGLPEAARTTDPQVMFTDLGLDSLAFLQVQTELNRAHGLPVDESAHAEDHSLGSIVDAVNAARAAA